MEKLQGYVQQGGHVVITSGVNSTTKVQASYPAATVTVYDAGTLNLSTIYSDNSSTPKANPFTCDSTGYFFFYAANARYDITFSGTGITSPFTLSDWLLQDLSSGGITSLNGLTPAAQTLSVGTSGSDFNIVDATDDHAFNLPTASASVRGALQAADWSTFNNKESTLSFTSPLSRSTNTISLSTVPITSGGTGQVTQTLAFNALSPATSKGDVIAHNGTNEVRLAVGANDTVLTADSSQPTGLKWALPFSTPVSVSQGGTGLTTLTGFAYGAGTTALTAVAASSQLQVLRRTPNVSTLAYQFAPTPYVVSSDYDFPAQTPGGTLTATVGASITLSPVPLGINGSDSNHYVYISGGSGSAEACLITGGSAVSGASSGTITFTPANSHSGAWTVTSATGGVQEAISVLPLGNNQVIVPAGTTTLNANLSFMGKTNAVVVLSNGLTLAGAGTLPTPTIVGNFIMDWRTGFVSASKGADIASGNTIAPITAIAHITGTGLLKTITVPSGFRFGFIWLIFDGAATTDTSGNIGRAITAVANTCYGFIFDGSKWYPTGA